MIRSFKHHCRKCDNRWALFTNAHSDVVCPYCGCRDVATEETEDWPPRHT